MKRLYVCAAALIALALPYYSEASQGITNKTKYTVVVRVAYRDTNFASSPYEIMYPDLHQTLSPGESWKPNSYEGAFIANVEVLIPSFTGLIPKGSLEAPRGCQLDIITDASGVIHFVQIPCAQKR